MQNKPTEIAKQTLAYTFYFVIGFYVGLGIDLLFNQIWSLRKLTQLSFFLFMCLQISIVISLALTIEYIFGLERDYILFLRTGMFTGQIYIITKITDILNGSAK